MKQKLRELTRERVTIIEQLNTSHQKLVENTDKISVRI